MFLYNSFKFNHHKEDIMKKLFFSVITTLTLAISISMPTYASEDPSEFIPAWTCNLTFKAHAVGIQVIIGAFSVKGVGTLNCISPFKEIRTIPVSINMSSKYLTPRVSMGSFDIYGEALQINLFSNNPEDLLGTYLIAQGQGTVIAGAGALAAARVSFPHLSMNVSVQFVRGFGINAGFSRMTIMERY